MSFLTPATPRGRAQRQAAIRRNIAEYDWDLMFRTIDDAFVTARNAVGEFTYVDGQRECADLAHRHSVPLSTAIGVVAALSPGTAWERNLELADELLATNDCAHAYGADPIDKARAIRAGEHWSKVLGGRKVRSFAHCLTDPESPHLCVDRHQFSAALGAHLAPVQQGRRTVTLTDRELKALGKVGTYQMIAAVHRTVARKYDTAPGTVQATIWTWYRQVHAYHPEGRDHSADTRNRGWSPDAHLDF